MIEAHTPAYTLEPEKRVVENNQPAHPRTPNFINDIAAGKVELPTIPRVVQQLIAALRDPDVDTRKIGEALSQDPVLSAKVLRLANSAFFGGQRSMASIDAAVALIGIQALNRLIVACGVSSSFKDIPGLDLRVFWRDSLIAATAANKLAPRLQADAEEAYTCGLLHGTGHLILCQTYPDIANVDVQRLRGDARRRARDDRDRLVRHRPPGGRRALGREPRLPARRRRHDQEVGATARRAATGRSISPLRSACLLAAAVAQKDSAETALAALPPRAAAKLAGADGKPDAAFVKLYEALQETEPTM